MASICKEQKGRKRIAFVDAQGQHRSLRIGKATVTEARAVCVHVEQLLKEQKLGIPHSSETATWLAALPAGMLKRLENTGLLRVRRQAITLKELIDRFQAAQSVKRATLATYKQCTDSLLSHFGPSKLINTIDAASAAAWRSRIAQTGRVREKEGPRSLSPATVAKRVNIAKAIFARARDWKLIDESPFTRVKSGSQTNAARAAYVSSEDTKKLLAACPDNEWRAIIGLTRFAGLRCPSEICELKWSDLDKTKKSLMVRSSKTASSATKGVRTVPVSPELQALLSALELEADGDAGHMIKLVQGKGCNLRTRFTKIIQRAGLKPWPRLFHNLRASCATDFAESLPNHEAARYLGHSPMIAATHYLQPRDHNFRAITGDQPWKGDGSEPAKVAAGGVQSGGKSGVQSGVQSGVRVA